MEFVMIAVIGDNEAFRLLSIQTREIVNANVKNIYYALSNHEIFIKNLEISTTETNEPTVIESNGSLDRYTHLTENLRVKDKCPIIIIGKLEGFGYTITDYTGKIMNRNTTETLNAVEKRGVANGRVVYHNNIAVGVEPLGKSFLDIEWVQRANSKLALMKLNDYTIGVDGRIVVTNMNIKECIIPSGIDTIGDFTFNGCTKLSRVSIPHTVVKIGDCAFKACIAIKEIDIPSSIASIDEYAFQSCTELKTVELHEGLHKIGKRAFRNCARLSSIKIPDTVTHLGDSVFELCTELKNVIIGKNITKIDEYTFASCTQINSIFIPKNVESVDKFAFAYCSNLKQITLESSKTIIPNNLAECKDVKYIILGK